MKQLCKTIFKARILAVAMLLLTGVSASNLFAQQSPVSGVVTDEADEPLIGVNVVVKGTTIGTVTNFDGQFNLSASNGDVLVFTYIGMITQEVTVTNNRNLKIVMQDDRKALEEVVVIGYGTQKKADLTTAVSTVSSEEWSERPIMSAQQALQGKAAGVQVVQPSGKPGVGMSVRVRGATSIYAGNDPLYVVDGVTTTDISNISPNDIESMTILKDASSAAIYGARAANGVVLITTKRGSKGEAQINFSSYVGFSNISKNIETLNTKEYYDLMTEMGYSIDYTNRNYNNWAKEMYGTGLQQNYQLSLSGGTEKVDYFISGGYQNEKGIIAPADYDRFSFRSNINAELKKWVKITSNLSLARISRQDVADNNSSGRGGVIMSILNTPPFLSVWDADNPGQYMVNPFQSSWENPVAQADLYDMNRDTRFMGNVGLDFSIIKGLNFKPSFAMDYTAHGWDKFIDPIKTGQGRNTNGKGEHADDEYLTWTSDNILTYDTKFGADHNFSAMGGATFLRYRHYNAYMTAEDFVQGTNFENMTLNMANKITEATSSKDGYSLVSFLGRVQYDYKSRYLITATMRADGSSKLHPDHRWGYFPSASAGWRFSDENFFRSLTTVVDDAKLRVAWGQNGNQNGIGNYDYYDKYYVSKQDDTGKGPAVSLGKLGNRDLKWETTTQYNAGLDLSFFGSRLVGEFDIYYKHTKDLLLNIVLPETIGYDLPMRNDGEMLNKGFEFNLTGRILTGAFKWDATANMSFNRNEIKKLSLTPQYTDGGLEDKGDIILIKEGLSLGTFYGYVAQGVDPETGEMMYWDKNENGEVDPGDRTIIGSAQPDFTFGLSNNFSWKNLTLTAFFQGSYGNDIYNATRMDTEGMVNQNNQSTAVLNRWQRPGMITDVPKAGGEYNSLISSRFVEDGSYIRLKTLSLAYNFNRDLISKIGMNSLNVYVTANNLFTLTKYRGYDPELNSGGNSATLLGVDMGTYPQTRSFVFGLNLTF